jgi:hypothetical protein
MMMIVEQTVECQLAEEIEILGETLPQYHFVYHIFHMTLSEFEPGPPWWKAGD